MQINNVEQTPTFSARIKLKSIDAQLDKVSKDLGCDKSLLVGSGAMSALSASAGSLATANYSGLEKVLPINVSIPLATASTSSIGYKSLINKANKNAAQQVKNAKRRGQNISGDIPDADFVKPVIKNIVDRFKELFKLFGTNGNTKGNKNVKH